VAERADGCNLFGDPATVRAKLAVLHAHCAAVGRDPSEIEVTHLSTALAAPTADDVAKLAAELRPGKAAPSRYAASVHAGTVAEQVQRYGALADAGVETAIVRLPDLVRKPDAIARFAPVIAAFGP
jgi:alkanesulfonate monooxygenase SsuD/methylene tetrahydromethanopterin reductase-like flavin-dependent oxidoreductase (luciferase family)